MSVNTINNIFKNLNCRRDSVIIKYKDSKTIFVNLRTIIKQLEIYETKNKILPMFVTHIKSYLEHDLIINKAIIYIDKIINIERIEICIDLFVSLHLTCISCNSVKWDGFKCHNCKYEKYRKIIVENKIYENNNKSITPIDISEWDENLSKKLISSTTYNNLEKELADILNILYIYKCRIDHKVILTDKMKNMSEKIDNVICLCLLCNTKELLSDIYEHMKLIKW